MSTITKLNLSASTGGRPIKIVAVATLGTPIHVSHATDLDELWLWAVNSDSVDRKLTIEAGGVTSPDDLIEFTVPAEDGLHLVIPGIPYTGTITIGAFAAAANVVMVSGYVNRISP